MSGIIPISQSQIVLKNFSPDEVAAIEAANGIKIKGYDLKDLFPRVVIIVQQAVVMRGEKMQADDMGRVAKEFTDELKTTFSTFTVEEVMQAVRAWCSGKLYEEGKHVSVLNLCKCIWHWRDSVKREALDKIRKEELKKEEEKSEEYKQEGQELFKEQVLQEFNYWKEHGTIMHSGPSSRAWHAFLYLWFKERGYCLPNDEAMEIKDQADKMIQRDRAVKAEHKRAHLEELEERRKELAREMALPVLFAKFVKHGIKLEDLWN